jgi:dephospho-CoA kinase
VNTASASAPALCVALTGGIASGKTTVSNLFAVLGVSIIDADVVARELVAPGQPALMEIVRAFGASMLTAQGELDRKQMRAAIFGNDTLRLRLEAILHPRVRSTLMTRARDCVKAYCILAIPLLAESAHAYEWIDRTLVVDVPRSTQLARLMQRDGMTAVYAEQILSAQASREQRLALADDVIDNAGLPEGLADAVRKLDGRYRALAH